MPQFAFRASTASGRIMRGVEQAGSAAAVERALAERGLHTLEIRPLVPGGTRRRSLRPLRADVADAVHQLAALLEAGLTLDRALQSVTGAARRREVARSLAAIQDRVRGGAALSDALAEHPRVFPRLAVGMARAGERGGRLAQALALLAEELEQQDSLRQDVLSAILYPALLTLVGGAALVVLMVYVLPRFASVFAELGATLPPAAGLLLNTGEVLRQWSWALALGGLALVALGWMYRRSPSGTITTDGWLLSLPIIGPLRQQVAAARFGRTLSALLGSGLPILPAMDVAAAGLTDEIALREVGQARDRVAAGKRLATALGEGRAFPPVFLQMVEVGEEGGRLPEMLARAARLSEQDLRRSLTRAVRLIEPVFIVVFGVAAGFVALALLQTIYGLRVDVFR